MEDIKKFQDVYRRSVDGHNCQLSDTKQGGRILGHWVQPFVVAKIFKGLASVLQLSRGAQAAELAVSLEKAAAAAQEGEALLHTGQTARTAATGAKVAQTAAQEGKALMQTGQAARTAATGAAKTGQVASKAATGAAKTGQIVSTAAAGAAKTGQTARTAAAGEQLGETFVTAQTGRNIAGAGVMAEEVPAATEVLQTGQTTSKAAAGAAAQTSLQGGEIVTEGANVIQVGEYTVGEYTFLDSAAQHYTETVRHGKNAGQ